MCLSDSFDRKATRPQQDKTNKRKKTNPKCSLFLKVLGLFFMFWFIGVSTRPLLFLLRTSKPLGGALDNGSHCSACPPSAFPLVSLLKADDCRLNKPVRSFPRAQTCSLNFVNLTFDWIDSFSEKNRTKLSVYLIQKENRIKILHSQVLDVVNLAKFYLILTMKLSPSCPSLADRPTATLAVCSPCKALYPNTPRPSCSPNNLLPPLSHLEVPHALALLPAR